METVANFIHGECVTGSGQRVQAIFNPATGEQIRQVVMSSTRETEQAIAAAHDAFPGWARHSPLKRARVMFRFKALLEQNMERLARIISEEHGKVFSDAVGELTRGLEVVEFACGIPHLQKGEHSANVGTGVDSHSLMQPLGVCVGITPFNFPAMVPMWMFPIALATGNSFVLKPSEKDPSLALALAKLMQEAGLPDGVFNVVQGDKESVDVLLTDPRVQAVSFVGSTPIAEYIYQTASAHGKRCQALGGAKNHCILMPDADMDMATNAIMGAAYGAAGERCMALSVVLAVGDKPRMSCARDWKNRLRRCASDRGLIRRRKTKWGRLSPRRTVIKYSDTSTAGNHRGPACVWMVGVLALKAMSRAILSGQPCLITSRRK